MKDIVLHVAKRLVSYPDEVEVSEVVNNGIVDIQLKVHADDMGKIIGKRGRIANALRSILKACAIKEQKKVNLEISSKE